MSDRYKKNIERISDVVEGNYKGKIQSGYTPDTPHREVGDKWTDSDGVEWEQKKGYKMKISKVQVGMFPHQCKDCKKNCDPLKVDKDTYMRMGRCYHCQIDYEVDLKAKKFGEKNNLWFFWVKLQNLMRWDSIDREVEEYMIQAGNISNRGFYDKKLNQALTNNEIQISREKASS